MSSEATAPGRALLLLAAAVAIGIVLAYRTGGHPATATVSPASAASPAPAAGSPPAGSRPSAGSHGASASHTGAGAASGSGARSSTQATTPAHPAGQVVTLVANGTKVSGAAGKVGDVLRKAGYNVLSPANANGSVSSSSVYYSSGFAAAAAAVAHLLGLPASAARAEPAHPPVPNLQGADVVVVVGQGLASHPPSGSGSSTSGS